MKIFKQHGTKEKLFEMMERVNKVRLKESFDNPKERDEKYLNKGGDDEAIDAQVNKYDDGYREPRERNIQVNDPSLEKMKGADEPIKEGPLEKLNASFSSWKEAWDDLFPPTTTNRKNRMATPYSGGAGHSMAMGQKQQIADTIKEKYINLLRSVGVENPMVKDLAQQYKQVTGDEIETVNSSYIPEGEEETTDTNNSDELESKSISSDFWENLDGGGEELEGGLADDKVSHDFDPKQILLGMEVEMEHTNDPKEALEIAMDHLVENPQYYGGDGDNPEDEAQKNAEMDAEEIENDVIGSDENEDIDATEKIEDDNLKVNMNWLESIKPNKVDDMEI